MYTKEALDTLYRKISETIDISDDMFQKAETEYMALGQWINDVTPSYKISIYPQGSFALGTVIRPIDDRDDYDLDLVCEFAHSYGLSARELKINITKPLLTSFKQIDGEIIEKRRCWHVNYRDIPQFHMDVIPAYVDNGIIQITDHDEIFDTYEYMGSNPAGYIEWFFSKCAIQHTRLYDAYVKEHQLIVAKADIERVKRQKVKTPLQRVIQLLKRHRDIMFEASNGHEKPVSIIITTIAAQLYQDEDNVFDALKNILCSAKQYIENNKRGGLYYIENPSYPGENFADKWNEHEERAKAFLRWLSQAYRDLVSDSIFYLSKTDMGKHLSLVLSSSTVTNVFSRMATEDRLAIKDGSLKVLPTAGGLSTSGSISVPPNHHHGA